jgi:hypothetical protein
MMWEEAKLVTLKSARVPVGVPRSVAPSASHEAVPIGDLANSVPVRHVSDQIGNEEGPGSIGDHGFDPADVDEVRSGLHINEAGHQPGADDGSDVGGECHGGADDLVTGLCGQKLDREVERRTARVDHHPGPLSEERCDRPLHCAYPPPDPQATWITEHVDDG